MMAIALFAVAFLASALGGVLGMASGIFIVPLLTLAFGIGIHAAVGASIVSVIACSCAGAGPFLRRGLVNVRLAVVLEVATTLGALTGVLLSGLFPDRLLYAIFAAVLAVSAWQMLVRRRDPAMVPNVPTEASAWASRLHLHGTTAGDGGTRIPYRIGSLPVGLSLMYAAGLISALLGIGSGVLKIPAMDTALRLPLKVSSATSTFMIGVTASASAGAYWLRGDVNVALAAPIALGSVLGALLGARTLIGLPEEKVRFFFVAVLGLLTVQMAASALGLAPVPGGE